jgi:hypothetical protein
MHLLLQDRPLLRFPALRIGPTAIVGKEGLLAKVIQAALIFSMSVPMRDARLAKEVGEVIVVLVPAKSVQAVMHPQQVPTVHGLQTCPAIEAIEGHHGLRFD